MYTVTAQPQEPTSMTLYMRQSVEVHLLHCLIYNIMQSENTTVPLILSFMLLSIK